MKIILAIILESFTVESFRKVNLHAYQKVHCTTNIDDNTYCNHDQIIPHWQ